MVEKWASLRRIAVLAMAVSLCLPAAVSAQSDRNSLAGTYASANYLTGTVQSVNRDLNYVTIRDQAGRETKIDVRRMETRQSINVWKLRPGDVIIANGGWENRDTFEARTVSFSTFHADASSGPNTIAGTVDRVNRKLNFVTVRDQATGRNVKVDVRRMDTRESVNVWQLRPGDPIVVNGGWTNRNTFRASRINVSSMQPMTSAYDTANFVGGTVQSVNRDLNYVTVLNEATGQSVKVDVRRMDTRRSVNVWQLRSGDRIAVNGTWSDRDTFQADTINF